MKELAGMNATFVLNTSDNMHPAILQPPDNLKGDVLYGALPYGPCRDFYEQLFTLDNHPDETKELLVEILDRYYRIANGLVAKRQDSLKFEKSTHLSLGCLIYRKPTLGLIGSLPLLLQPREWGWTLILL